MFHELKLKPRSNNKYFKAKQHPVVPAIITRNSKRRAAFKAMLRSMPTHQDAPAGVPFETIIAGRDTKAKIREALADPKRCDRVTIKRSVRREMARLAAKVSK